MSGSTDDDGYEDVAVFLQRIKELGDKRDQEDRDRTKKLEEQLLQDRVERQARRAERARSISPTKSSPSNTPTASKTSAALPSRLSQVLSPRLDSSQDTDASRDDAVSRTMNQLTSTENPDQKENFALRDGERSQGSPSPPKRTSITSPSAAMPSSRNSGLAWQRRPASQSSDHPRSRPLSMVATENAARSPRSTPAPESASRPVPESLPSREDIAQSLASKDPSWFRQTSDRGLSSPAYRTSQVEDFDRSDHGSMTSRIQMPGMAREVQQSKDEQLSRSPSPSRTSITMDSRSIKSTNVTSGTGSPLQLTAAQRFDPPTTTYEPEVRMSPTQGRISPERTDPPASPTKGMGGFVQSAMLKRSDSVQKRWSVQSSTGLSRGNSVAGQQRSQDLSGGSALGGTSIILERDAAMGIYRDTSRPSSRPTSSHNHTGIFQDRPGTSGSMKSSITASTNESFVKTALPHSEIATLDGKSAKMEDSTPAVTTPPASPSKADSRRWSPTKSSWLESALNKPESPKPRLVATPQQPAWMSELTKTKKSSVDLDRNSPTNPRHEVSIGGLLRSPPLGGASKSPTSAERSLGSLSKTSAKSTSESIPVENKQNTTRSPEIVNVSSAKLVSLTATSPVLAKVKPETPPKKDWRSSLKSRPAPVDSESNEAEFKNVFGQLRKTKTQNFVAPDELKDNITRGKAALNITGGPKVTERRDEFKEAILKKKEDFKKAQLEGTGIQRSSVTSTPGTALPEALAKRNSMRKLESPTNDNDMLREKKSSTPFIRHNPPPALPFNEPSATGRLQSKNTSVGKLANRLNPALSSLLARGPPPIASDVSRSPSSGMSPKSISTSTSTDRAKGTESGPQLTHMTKGRARGPRRKAPSAVATGEAKSDAQASEGLDAASSESPLRPSHLDEQSATLKSSQAVERASSVGDGGPPISQPSSPQKLDMKRRSQFLQGPSKATQSEPQLEPPKPLSPTHKANTVEILVNPQKPTYVSPTAPITKTKPSAPFKSPTLRAPDSTQSFASLDSDVPNIGVSGPAPSSTMVVPVTSPTKSIALPETEITPLVNGKASNIAWSSSMPVASGIEETKGTMPRHVPRSPSKTQLNAFPIQPTPSLGPNSTAPIIHTEISSVLFTKQADGEVQSPTSVKAAKEMWNRSAATATTSTVRRVPSPIKLPTEYDEKAAMISSGLRASSPVKNLSSAKPGQHSTSSASPIKVPISPAKPAASRSPEGRLPISPSSQASEASTQLANFFDNRISVQEYATDTASILMARPNNEFHAKTLSSILYLLSSDGRKTRVPDHQERVLFEQNMYLCVHTFNNIASKKMNECYFWIGDGVAPEIVAGVEALVQKEANSTGSNLHKFHQGKESPGLLQALGGIIIIRRGSASKYDSLAPYIVCGRQFFGQIVFDEVDYNPSSLCSGFPFLITTKSGKSYLWKGKGCGVDELSCARLIGMDAGITGEVVEIEDGLEPPSFLQIFGHAARMTNSADHWRMKSSYNKYGGRLFCADVAAKVQIYEITPFTQTDLLPTNVYILDAFFEIYIIVGSSAQHQHAAFQNALIFVQEYAILAAGMEDRPFVPVSTVVIEGIPRDMKAVFRKWKEGTSPTAMVEKEAMSPGLRRGMSLRVVPLAVAVEATRR